MLSQANIDAWWTFGISSLCVLSCLANLFSAFIFRSMIRSSPKVLITKYLFVKSLITTFYLLSCSCVFMIKCNNLCTQWFSLSPGYSFAQKLVEFFIYNYLSTCLAMFDLFVEVCIALERLSVIVNHPGKHMERVHVIVPCLALFVFAYFSPNLVLYKIKRNETTDLYYLSITDFHLFKIYVIAILVLRAGLVFFLMIVINIISCHCYTQRMRLKRTMNITNENIRSSECFYNNDTNYDDF